MESDAACQNCGSGIYRAQNYPMDGGWHWLHTVSKDRRCSLFAEPIRQTATRHKSCYPAGTRRTIIGKD